MNLHSENSKFSRVPHVLLLVLSVFLVIIGAIKHSIFGACLGGFFILYCLLNIFAADSIYTKICNKSMGFLLVVLIVYIFLIQDLLDKVRMK